MTRKISLEKLCIFLYILISMVAPNSGATSVKVIRVVVVVAIMIGFMRRGGMRLPHKGERYYIIWTLLFLAYCALGIGSAYSHSMATSFFTTTLYVFAVDLLIFIYVISYMKDVEGIIDCMIMGATLAALRCFVQYGPTVFYTARSAGSISGNTIGQFSAFACILCIYKIWEYGVRPRFTKTNAAWIMVLVLNFVFMILSGSRKSVFYLVIPIVVMLMLNSKNPVRLFRNIIIAAVLVGVGYYALMHISVLYNAIGYRIQSMMNGLRGTGISDSSTVTRLNLINRGMNFFRERPWIGYGLNNFYVLNNMTTGSLYYAHNNYVELLVDCGIIGTVIYYSLHASTLVKAIKMHKVYSKDIGIFIGILISILVCDYGIVSYYDIFTQALTLVTVLVILHPEFLRKRSGGINYGQAKGIRQESV